MRRPPPASLRELEIRASALCGHNVGEIAAALGVHLPSTPRRAKGFVGQLLELALGADPRAKSGPDFPSLGVELKTIPVGPEGLPKESTFVCSVAMLTADHERWETSRLRRRLARVLWVPVDGARVAPLPARRVGRARLWQPSPEEEAQIAADWEDLTGAIGAGRSGTLTAREGKVLQLRPKASRASVRALAPGTDGPEMTLPLGFYLRRSFTAALLSPP